MNDEIPEAQKVEILIDDIKNEIEKLDNLASPMRRRIAAEDLIGFIKLRYLSSEASS